MNASRLKRFFLGPAKDPLHPRVFHALSLAAFFAWVGIGADGLSSSCYGPEEAFLALGDHRILAIPLALLMAITVFVISASYSQIIELFPTGGGGYLVATKLLGRGPGVVCGCALVLDYILTIAISVASGVAALSSALHDWITPEDALALRPYAALAIVGVLIMMNLRGVKESVIALLPIFLLFITTHIAVLAVILVRGASGIGDLVTTFPDTITTTANDIGWMALAGIFLAAYAIGGGTYTGIEALSNSVQILREPRVETGRRTMFYMALSLAFVATGLLLGYLLFDVHEVPGKTLNAVLFDRAWGDFRLGGFPAGGLLILLTLISEGALLFVAAQAGFIGGPRTLATMALDRWVPARFSHLSNRLVIQDGVIFMGGAAAIFIAATGASVKVLVILYSINVFVTFTLSQLGMCVHWLRTRAKGSPNWKRKLAINGTGLLLTSLVLTLMIGYKLMAGAWVTLVVTASAVAVCFWVRSHHQKIREQLRQFDALRNVPFVTEAVLPPSRPVDGPTAVLLVGGFHGLGLHSFLTVLARFPSYFKNFIFVSVGVLDFGEFKGFDEIENLRRRTGEELERYVTQARSMGLYAESRFSIGVDLVNEIETLALGVVKDFPRAVFFGGQLIFESEGVFSRILHSQAGFEIQRRLQFAGLPMMLLPVRVAEDSG